MCNLFVGLVLAFVSLHAQLCRANTTRMDDSAETNVHITALRETCPLNVEQMQFLNCPGFVGSAANRTDHPQKFNMIEITCRLHWLGNLIELESHDEKIMIVYDSVSKVNYTIEKDSCAFPSTPVSKILGLTLYSWALCLSTLFLCATLGVYLAVPTLRQKVYDKCILCHVVTLAFGFCCLIGVNDIITVKSSYCALFGYLTQFWLLSSFCWLNVMCISMWRHIKSKLPLSGHTFIPSCLYAWGCPLLLSSITIGANKLLAPDSPFRSRFGEDYCWFVRYDSLENQDLSNNVRHFLKAFFEFKDTGPFWIDPSFLYFYGIVSVSILINFYVFVDTAYLLFVGNKRWKTDENQESQRHGGHQTRFFQYLKLFLLMGLNLIMVMVSYYSGKISGIWHAINLINALQGIFIFAIFVCNKRVISHFTLHWWPEVKDLNRRG